ncbi:MAG: SRPBCC domain-containing protein, partial [Thermoplasmata archaeon]|nr:SRPBCC domain-containing protein [Thermoplasmata archaeon]
MVDIHHTVDIDTPVDQVYRAVTEQEGLRGWWTRKAIAAPEVGHKNEFPFPSGDYNAMRIVDLEPDSRVEWVCIEGTEEWVGTRIVFSMEV